MKGVWIETKKINLKPAWLKAKLPSGDNFFRLKKDLEKKGLFTICQSAKCPNIGECWDKNNATFLIMGDICTRNCYFCSVNHGSPKPLDAVEPFKILETANMMKLKYMVITSVTRDDLKDGGSFHYARVISYLKSKRPDLIIEILIPDLNANMEHLNHILEAKPDVVGHNLESVKRLYSNINRKPENYTKSLAILDHSREKGFITKSGIMVGLGETYDEITRVFNDLRRIGVNLLTIGQYLQPTRKNLPVAKYYNPDEFKQLKKTARAMGFNAVESGPFVRSSFNARIMYEQFIRSAKQIGANSKDREIFQGSAS